MIRRWIWLPLAAAETLALRAGQVHTVDGKTFAGQVQFARNDAVVVKRPDRQPLTIPLSNLWCATFSPADAALAQAGLLAEDWSARDIGTVGYAGGSGQGGSTWVLRGGGGYIGEKQDGLHFAYTKVTGNCEVTACVKSVSSDDRQGRVGIMLREDLAPPSKFAALLVKADGTCSFRVRTEWEKHAEIKSTSPALTPFWIRLKRQDHQITASKSADGKHWELLPTTPVPLSESVLVGLAIANRNAQAPCVAQLESVRLTLNGLRGEYFAGEQFSGYQFSRVDPLVNFAWGLGAPDPRVGADNFSVRWTGQIEPKHSQPYVFHCDADDAAKLWVNGQAVSPASFKHEADHQAQGIPLRAGQRYDVKLEYREGGGSASVRLGWSSPSQPRELIPTPNLFCTIEPRIEPVATSPPPPSQPQPLTKGIWLRSGTFLAGTVKAVGQTHVKFAASTGREWSVLTHHVAALVFRSPKRPITLEEAAGRTGVLLENGDFFEGAIRELKDRRITVSSVLFGVRQFYQDNGEVAAWLLRVSDGPTSPSLYALRVADGSRLMTRSVRVEGETVVVLEQCLGDMPVPQHTVVEVRKTGY